MPLPSPMPNPKRCAGFSLIEVMVAMVILTLGLFAVINLQVIAVRGNTFSRARTDAQKIAQGVADEIRTEALRWVDSNIMTDLTWNGIMSDLPLTGAPLNNGSNLNLQVLGSVPTYQDNVIAADNVVTSALLIDVAGNTGPGAMYRVHYVAHGVAVEAGATVPADPDLVRVTVLVSWDSKDHGQQNYDWGAWWSGGNNYFKRHIVSVTQFLSKRRL